MKLLLEVLGVLVIAGAITAPYSAARTPIASAVLIAAVITGVAFWSGVWPEAKALITAHNSNGRLTRDEANTRGGALFPANEGFLAFADKAIPRTAHVYLF